MSAEMRFDEVLDAKNLPCVRPIVKIVKAVDALSKGQVLKAETTELGSKIDVRSWAKKTGNKLLKVEEGSGVFTFYIKKTT